MSEESLKRILDREGVYWRYPGDLQDNPERVRLVEMRIDVKASLAKRALDLLLSNGWILESQPDDPSDPIQRLYFRKFQDLTVAQREAMLKAGYHASEAGEGRLWSWVNVEDAP